MNGVVGLRNTVIPEARSLRNCKYFSIHFPRKVQLSGYKFNFCSLLQVSKAYSKTWSFREDALLDVMKQMSELPPGSRDEARNMMRAAIFLVNKGIKDKVFAVSTIFHPRTRSTLHSCHHGLVFDKSKRQTSQGLVRREISNIITNLALHLLKITDLSLPSYTVQLKVMLNFVLSDI